MEHALQLKNVKEMEELKVEKYKQTKEVLKEKQCVGPQAKTSDD
jgi:hypothetical protein